MKVLVICVFLIITVILFIVTITPITNNRSGVNYQYIYIAATPEDGLQLFTSNGIYGKHWWYESALEGRELTAEEIIYYLTMEPEFFD